MPYALGPYRKNISRKVKIAGLILLFISQYFVSGLNGDIGPRVTSYFGLDSDKVSFYLHIGTVGMVALLPLTYRFRSYFRRVSLLMWTLGGQLLISLLCYFTESELLLMLSSFIMGGLKIIVILDFLSLLIGLFPILRNRGIFYGLFYGFARSVREISTFITLNVIENYHWKDLFLISAIVIVCTIILCLFLFQPRRTERKVPLYQAEWSSALLIVIMGISLGYTLIMGKEKDWFGSKEIFYSSLIFVVSTIVFAYRQYHIKRPFWNFRLFSRYRQIPIGASLMIIMYLFYSTSILFNIFIDYNFKGEENYPAYFGLLNMCCYLIFFPLTGWMIHKGVSRRLMICLGFLFFAFSLIHFSEVIQRKLTFWDLGPSMIASAIGYALLLTNSAAYLATNIPRKDNKDRVMVTITARYVLGSFLAFSLFSNWLYRRIQVHVSHLSEYLNNNNPVFLKGGKAFSEIWKSKGLDLQQAHLNAMRLFREKLQVQSMLFSIREITFIVGISALVFAVIVLFIRHFEMHKEPGKNKYKITPW